MKKTTLNDDAALYEKRVDGMSKEKWQEMNAQEKAAFFKDYLLVPLLIGIAVVAALVYVGWTVLRPKPETLLYVAVVDSLMDPEDAQALQEDISALLGEEGKRQEVIIDDSISLTAANVPKFQVYAMAGQLDVVFADREKFEKLADGGYLYDAAEVLEEAGAGDEVPYVEANSQETGPGKYGVSLSGIPQIADWFPVMEEPVFAFVRGMKHSDHAVKYLEHLLDAAA